MSEMAALTESQLRDIFNGDMKVGIEAFELVSTKYKDAWAGGSIVEKLQLDDIHWLVRLRRDSCPDEWYLERRYR